MNDFPLSPFLASLAGDDIRPTIRDYERIGLAFQTGGPWTITRLRDTLLALIAKDADQQEIFLRRFDDFFKLGPDAENAFADVDLERALAELAQLAQAQPAIQEPRSAVPSWPRRTVEKTKKKPKVAFELWMTLPIVLILGMLVVISLRIATDGEDSLQTVTPEGGGIVEDSPTSPPTGRKRLYTNVPYAKSIEYLPLSAEWQRYAAIAVLLLCATLLYGLYLWRSRKIPEDQPAYWDKGRPRHFSPGAIGGQPAPLFHDETLHQLADSMGYFQSTRSGKVLNVPASVEATLRSGGIPTLEFCRRKQIRSLLILEDAFAEATAWNAIARELAEGMQQRGVPVLYGQFCGSPERFKTEDGSVYHLEDLEDQRRGLLLLIFTDGKGLYQHESTFALEALARWPMVAWMELREPRFWDETSVLPTRYGIPMYPATPAGTVRAVRRFLTEQGAQPDFSEQAIHWPGLPDQVGANLEGYVEELLGDALMWTQDCAMLQPVSPGLAGALRREFHPHLPPERIERLYVLPGTQRNVSGLRFSDEVLRVLRTGFLIRRDEDEQEDILRFLLQKIQEAEPDEEDSLAHLAWETVKERIRLELDPDDDLARMAQLAQTPLGSAVSASLDNFGFPDQAGKIPLRLKPRSKHALQRLARIAEDFSIPILKAYPIAWGHWLALGILFFSFLGFSGWSVLSYTETPSWDIDSLYAIAALRLELLEEGTWQEVWHHIRDAGTTDATFGQSLLEGRDYGLTLYGGGYQTIEKLSTTYDSIPRIELGWQDVEVDCREEFPDVGLTVRRCPDSENAETEAIQLPLWQTRTTYQLGRLMSAGLEISTDGQNDALLQRWHNTLLQTGSIDVLYRIQPNSSGEWNIEQALEQLQMDLGPLAKQSQLVWWKAGQTPDTVAIEDLSSEFDRILKLGDGENLSWIASLETLFERAEDPLVWENEIMAALGQEQPVADGTPVILIRPSWKRVFIDPPSGEINVGDTTTVDIRIENVTGLFGAEVHLTFDPNLLEVVDSDAGTDGVQIKPGSFLNPFFTAQNIVDQAHGKIHFALSQGPNDDPVNGSGVLATITFMGKAAGTSALNFSTTQPIPPVILADNSGTTIGSAIENESIIVTGGVLPTPTPTLTPTPTSIPTLTPTPTSTPTPLPPTATTPPRAITPEPIAPALGRTYEKNPVDFRWSGSLDVGQTYRVTAWHVKSGYGIQSELLTSQGWTAHLPADEYGEWRWSVSVVQDGSRIATSSEWMFWFSP